MAPHHQNSPTIQQRTNGKSRTGTGRKPTLPTGSQTRPIKVTTEDTSIHLTLMMMTKMDIKTLVYYVHLTQLIAQEDYIKYKQMFTVEGARACLSVDR
jgi:hypothetical protein